MTEGDTNTEVGDITEGTMAVNELNGEPALKDIEEGVEGTWTVNVCADNCV